MIKKKLNNLIKVFKKKLRFIVFFHQLLLVLINYQKLIICIYHKLSTRDNYPNQAGSISYLITILN